ncbi:MAG TPA: ferritin-like domain-containing protein [Terriglobales bacterium]|nr:ferritin-like domain-containing protein [Terriglobales bacterium]
MESTWHPSWSVKDLSFERVNPDSYRREMQLFLLLASASFVEITSHLYTDALVDYFRADREVTSWLRDHWLPEEMQHGLALKSYVMRAWPEFDWERSYRDFYREYALCCHRKQLGPTWTMEMAARCVVETGTATLYTMIHRLTSEPVLQALTACIKNDEINHYKHFYRYFMRFREKERTSRYAIARTLWKRIREVDQEDGYLAFKHVFSTCHPLEGFRQNDYRAFCAYYRQLATRYYPYEMAAKMLLRPLGLNPRLGSIAVSLLSTGAKQLARRGNTFAGSVQID